MTENGSAADLTLSPPPASATENQTEAFTSVNRDHLVSFLEAKAKRLRRHVIKMLAEAGSGHAGGSLSAADIVATLYFHALRHDPANPQWPDRDRFILSKGHCVPVLYAALAESGYFPQEELSTLRKFHSRLQGHTDRNAVPGVESSGGPIGMGLSFGLGMALAARLDSKKHHIYVLLGDGECDAGQVWEAAMAAAHFKVDNLTAIVDRNGIQNDSFTDSTMNLEPFAEKWRSFGWHVQEISGHSIPQILEALECAQQVHGCPTVIIARTIKGKGVSFIENNPDWHGRAPNAEEATRALAELE